MVDDQLDLVIERGRVVDGCGNPWFAGDIGIKGDRIRAIGRLTRVNAAKRIDADGRYVAPGFIDVHAHSDFALTINRHAHSQVGQGITTEVVGNCGFGAFPRKPATRNLLFDPPGVEGDWETAEEYLQVLGSAPTGDNVAALMGLGTVRKLVVGDADRPATKAELDAMRSEVAAAMEAGAFGVSTGLDYPPSSYATVDELVALCEVVADYGGVYASHLRGYTDTAVESVCEAIEIGERSGVAVQLSHMNVFGRPYWGQVEKIVDTVNEARERGVDVTADIMAYPTAGAWWAPRAIFPESHYDWQAEQSGQLDRLRKFLADPKEREQLKQLVEERRSMPKSGFHEELLIFSDWRDIYLAETRADSELAIFRGKSFAEIAEQVGAEPVDVFFDSILSEGDDWSAVNIAISQDEADHLIKQPWMMFGTDSIATSIDRWQEPYNTIMSHPRHYATYVRILTDLVRDRRLLTLEDAVRKMTSLAAARFRLQGRGRLAVGAYADLVVFDLDRLAEVATWRQPRQHPRGIEAVIVNGVETVAAGTFTGHLGGRPLQLETERK